MQKLKKIAAYILPVVVFMAVLSVSLPAQAQGVKIPPGTPITLTNIGEYITTIVNFVVGISITIAVGFIAYGGILYITSAGDPAKSKKGKDTVLNGIIGLAIILAIGVIISTVTNLVQTRSTIGG